MDHYSNSCYAQLMRGTSAEETLQDKESYKRLAATHGARVCVYRAGKGMLSYPLLEETIQNCGQDIIYCGVGFHHQNAILEHRIKELTLCIWTLLLHATIL